MGPSACLVKKMKVDYFDEVQQGDYVVLVGAATGPDMGYKWTSERWMPFVVMLA